MFLTILTVKFISIILAWVIFHFFLSQVQVDFKWSTFILLPYVFTTQSFKSSHFKLLVDQEFLIESSSSSNHSFSAHSWKAHDREDSISLHYQPSLSFLLVLRLFSHEEFSDLTFHILSLKLFFHLSLSYLG